MSSVYTSFRPICIAGPFYDITLPSINTPVLGEVILPSINTPVPLSEVIVPLINTVVSALLLLEDISPLIYTAV